MKFRRLTLDEAHDTLRSVIDTGEHPLPIYYVSLLGDYSRRYIRYTNGQLSLCAEDGAEVIPGCLYASMMQSLSGTLWKTLDTSVERRPLL